MLTASRSIVTSYREARHIAFSSGLARMLGDRGETEGRLSLMHVSHEPGSSTPLHIHHNHDEALFIIDGEAHGVLGDEPWTADSGSFVWLPRGVPHAFQAVSSRTLEMLVMLVPGAADDEITSPGLAYGQVMDHASTLHDPASLASRHGIEIVGAPVNYLAG